MYGVRGRVSVTLQLQTIPANEVVEIIKGTCVYLGAIYDGLVYMRVTLVAMGDPVSHDPFSLI